MTKLLEYCRLARFNRPAGALLLLWPTLWGLWLAAKDIPETTMLAVFVGGVFCMRAFGCAVNDIADRKLDAQVERTKNRPLAAGTITVAEAVGVAVFFLALSFVLWLQLPTVAKWWAMLGLAVAMLYPLAKRIMPLPQAVLGVAFGFGILVGYAAVRQSSPPAEAWWFVIANWFWVMAYDTIYAMCDRDDDIRAGAKSSAIAFGEKDVTVVSMCYIAAVVLLSSAGIWFFPQSLGYQVALIGAMSLVFVFWRLYRWRQPEQCLLAFRLNHWFGAFVWAGLVSAFL